MSARVRPVAVCASGRAAVEDVVGNKVTVIALAASRLAAAGDPSGHPAFLAMVLDAAGALEKFLRGLSSCHACQGCRRDDDPPG